MSDSQSHKGDYIVLQNQGKPGHAGHVVTL